MSMLRRSHEHHRDLQARRDAAISTAAANRDQDRYVMTTIPKNFHGVTSQIQNTDFSRWSSTRHSGARSNACLKSQLVHRSSLLKADTCPRRALLTPGNVVDQCAHGSRLPSRTSSAALKSP
jgi:hypothetical protein